MTACEVAFYCTGTALAPSSVSHQMDNARQRLNTLASHLGSSSSNLDVAELQHFLEHDNWETRNRLKELMKDDLYIP